MIVPIDAVVGDVSRVLWAMFRIGGFYMVVPVIGSQLVPPRVRIALTFATALAVAPALPEMPPIDDVSLGLFAQAVLQVAIGVGLGFATVLFYQIFVVAGQFIAMQMGLGFAAMVDPTNGVSVTVLGQFFLMLVSLTFVAMNGHLVLLDVLIEGFKHSPRGFGAPLDETAWQLAGLGGWMFSGAALIALPAVASLLIVNLAFGVMSRAAPQLSVFSLGFPFALVFGLVILWVSMYGFTPQFENLSRALFEFAARWSA
jgi:flagellar biosynthetic protein FliR